ncbi:chitinase II [Tanacetum coccineum]
MEEYNHQISFRADSLPITKISYVVNSRKEETMKITRGDNPLNLIVHPNFRLKQLGSSEWLEAKRLGLPPPPELATFGLTAKEKKRKRAEVIKEVFVTEDVRVDGMDRNLIPPPGIMPVQGFVINEPESGIFFMNGNTDIGFQRESEFHLAPTTELIRLQRQIKIDSVIAREMFSKMNYVIEAKSDCIKAREMVMKGLSRCEALESNVRRIQVKDIVKEVEDHLKTYSSAGMDISWLYGFEGLDLHVNTLLNTTGNMTNLGTLFDEWRVAIDSELKESTRDQKKLIWTMTGYYVPELDSLTAHTALYDPSSRVNTDYGINEWVKRGLPANKLVLGLAYHGYTWTLVDHNDNGIGAPAKSGSIIGDGSLNYDYIRKYLRSYKIEPVYNSTYVINYLTFGLLWVGFDDVEAIRAKVSYAKERVNGI